MASGEFWPTVDLKDPQLDQRLAQWQHFQPGDRKGNEPDESGIGSGRGNGAAAPKWLELMAAVIPIPSSRSSLQASSMARCVGRWLSPPSASK